ncbi:MAG: 30S ribosomal protein S17, partial [Candidatus Saccharimonadales bacterium]
TIIVTVESRKTHPVYKKQYLASKKFMAHDEKNQAKPGDRVEIIETVPMSARKRFTLNRIIERPTLTSEDLKAGDQDAPDLDKQPPKTAKPKIDKAKSEEPKV